MLGHYRPKPPTNYSMITNGTGPFNQPTPGHGLGILIHSSVPFTELNIRTDLQVLTIRAHLDKLTTICNIYISPQTTITAQDISDIINQLPEPYLLLGDMNAKHHLWGDPLIDNRGKIFENIMDNTNTALLNTGSPTHFHVQTNTTHAVDLSLCSGELLPLLEWKTLGDLHGSDHSPILIRLYDGTLPSRPTRYNLKKAKWNDFSTLTTFYGNNSHMPVQERYSCLIQLIQGAADLSIPKTNKINRTRPVPWWNQECTQLCYERKRALRRYQRSQLQADKIIYLIARSKAQYRLRSIKRKSWQEYISKINTTTPMSKIWTRIRKLSGKYPVTHPPCILHNGNLVGDQQQVSELLADHYSSVSSNTNYLDIFKQTQASREQHTLDFSPIEEESYNSPITRLEITNALKACPDSAPGEDLISYSMIKNLHHTAFNELIEIINILWSEGMFLTEWRRATILSFPKPDKDPQQKTSNRPIALTSSVCKITEKAINARLVRTLEEKGALSNSQFGFRRQKSTIDNLININTDILDSFSKKEHMVAVFFDLEKAYDTTWRYGILNALHLSGVRGPMAWFIQNFLSTRTFRTRIGSHLSTEHEQEQGVPQGSVLSCTLFILAINGILDTLPQHVKAMLYVDDLVIYTSSQYIPSIERRLQTSISRIEQWTKTNGFKFSTQKTVATHFHRKRGLQTEPSLFLYGNPIIFKSSTKYLGMIFDQRLRWTDHITMLKTKTTKALNILKCLSNTKWGGDRTTLLRLYRSIIRSKIDYGCFVYWTASKNQLQRLDPVHNAAIRICTGAFRSSPVVSLYAESGEPSLDLRRSQLSLQYMLRCCQSPDHSINDETLDHNLPDQEIHTTATFVDRVRSIFNNLPDPPTPNIIQSCHMNDPIWLLPNLACDGFCPPKKNALPPSIMRALFSDHVKEMHHNQQLIFTDGSKTENGVGFAVHYRENFSRKLSTETGIFTAELAAILKAVTIISKTEGNHKEYTIFTDSRSTIMALQSFNNYNPIVCSILHVVLRCMLRLGKSIHFCWVPSHVGVTGNEEADILARRAADSGTYAPTNTYFKDYFPILRRKLIEQWQCEWTATENNKLRKFKDNVKARKINIKPRSADVVVTRLRIGHTLLTHSYLMERSPPPLCEDCIVTLTVEHILAECPSYIESRNRFFPQCASMTHDDKMVFMLDHHSALLQYLKETDNIDRI